MGDLGMGIGAIFAGMTVGGINPCLGLATVVGLPIGFLAVKGQSFGNYLAGLSAVTPVTTTVGTDSITVFEPASTGLQLCLLGLKVSVIAFFAILSELLYQGTTVRVHFIQHADHLGRDWADHAMSIFYAQRETIITTFDKADLNHDGVIDANEFKAYMKLAAKN